MTCPDDNFSFWMSHLVIGNSSRVFTDPSQVFDVEAANINATNMTLTWKINDNESSSVYTYEIQVAWQNDSFNFTVKETHAVLSPLSSSTLYNVTVCPFLDGGSEGIPGFLQVYTRECTHCLLTFLACPLCPGPDT